MAQSLAQIYLHVVFSTKNRQPFLKDEALRNELHTYLTGTCRNLDCPSLQIGGVEDHVHVSCTLSKSHAAAELVRELKRESSKWIKKKDGKLRAFAWQSGYGAFSISPSHIKAVKSYIVNQEEHHKRETFQDEFRRLLKQYNVDYDERYVWD